MKKIILLAFTISVIIFSGCRNENSSQTTVGGSFTINGSITTMDSGWVYFQHEDSTGFVNDSVKIQNHAFTFTGKVSEPTLYHLWAGNEAFYMGHSGRKYINSDALAFFVENTTTQITIKDTINMAVLSSTPSQDMYVAYKKMLAPFDLRQHLIDIGYDKADERKDKIIGDSLDKVSDLLVKEEARAVGVFAKSHPNSIMSAWAVTANMLFEPNLEDLKDVYSSFSADVQQSGYGQKIKQAIATTELVGIGQPAPNFTQNDTADKPFSLSSLHGKYVLIDFWASWCPDCRRENPNVVAMFNKYKDKNFTVLGVSLDSKKANWLKAIHNEELTWAQVSDLKLWKNAVAGMYGVRSIPANFLIDPTGKIIGYNLIGDDLEKALAKTFN
jgi:peroxiredoxin